MCICSQSLVSVQWCPRCGQLWNRWGTGRYLYFTVNPRKECPEGFDELVCPNCREKSPETVSPETVAVAV